MTCFSAILSISKGCRMILSGETYQRPNWIRSPGFTNRQNQRFAIGVFYKCISSKRSPYHYGSHSGSSHRLGGEKKTTAGGGYWQCVQLKVNN